MTSSIHRRTVLAGGLALSAGPALAQGGADLVRVAIKTSKGLITIDLNVGKAPITAGNFLRYVDQKRYDKSTFYRASRIAEAPQYGVIEGGLRGDPARVLKPIAHESTIKTGLSHKDGTISMAIRTPGTATADFFICIGDQSSFDADPADPRKHPGFAAFGQVSDGMDVVRAILASPTSPTAGVGAMKGQMLSPPAPIVTIRRVAAA
jgi:peptidyl-prolyl cis-trans isomerase A (cyclophilin A)